jgi:hypothetical protein
MDPIEFELEASVLALAYTGNNGLRSSRPVLWNSPFCQRTNDRLICCQNGRALERQSPIAGSMTASHQGCGNSVPHKIAPAYGAADALITVFVWVDSYAS